MTAQYFNHYYTGIVLKISTSTDYLRIFPWANKSAGFSVPISTLGYYSLKISGLPGLSHNEVSGLVTLYVRIINSGKLI